MMKKDDSFDYDNYSIAKKLYESQNEKAGELALSHFEDFYNFIYAMATDENLLDGYEDISLISHATAFSSFMWEAVSYYDGSSLLAGSPDYRFEEYIEDATSDKYGGGLFLMVDYRSVYEGTIYMPRAFVDNPDEWKRYAVLGYINNRIKIAENDSLDL